MLNRIEFINQFASGIHLLDGATGTELRKAGMPQNCCAEQWILENPQSILSLQKKYADAGSEIIYAPTFLAQPLALQKWNLSANTEKINQELIALSRRAAPNCLIAGNMTTMQGFVNAHQTDYKNQIKSAYQIQMQALISGGSDVLVAETIMNSTEATILLELAQELNAPAIMISFTCMNCERLYSGELILDALRISEEKGAAAIGINCVTVSDELPKLVRTLYNHTSLSIICKPNAGIPINGEYPVDKLLFSSIMLDCIRNGAKMIGGCCGTTPSYIETLKKLLKTNNIEHRTENE